MIVLLNISREAANRPTALQYGVSPEGQRVPCHDRPDQEEDVGEEEMYLHLMLHLVPLFQVILTHKLRDANSSP